VEVGHVGACELDFGAERRLLSPLVHESQPSRDDQRAEDEDEAE
jgi:hypothetical protein